MDYIISRSISPLLGVEIENVNLSDSLNANDIQRLIDQFNYHHLVIFRNQKLTEADLIRVAKIFGEPTPALVPTFRLENYPVITRHSNIKDENKSPIGVVAPESVFHSDSYFSVNPSKATLLYSLKSPNCGGETHFVNMCIAFETLDGLTKKLISNKKAYYKNAYINQPPVIHPLVRTHPVTKRKALFVNIHRALGIEGLGEDEANQLLNYLYQHAIKPDLIYRHKWRDGDLLVWYNPTTMHCATRIDDSEERLLYRVLTKGDLPVA